MVPTENPVILLTGGTGYIGSIFTAFLLRGAGLEQVHSLGSRDLDVTDREAVHDVLRDTNPDIVIHLAAKADTDWCEEHFEEAKEVNVRGSLNVVEEALALGVHATYFSSACLYPDNSKAYSETDRLAAFCRYTETKLLAERELEPYLDRILNIRMRQPFSNHRHPRNLLQKLASYTDFIDEPNSMSHLEECLPIVWGLAIDGEVGTWNMTNEGWTTPLRIARMIKQHRKPDMTVREITYEELLDRVDAVRVNALVDCSRLKARGYSPRHVEEAVRDCLRNPCRIGEYDWGGSEG